MTSDTSRHHTGHGLTLARVLLGVQSVLMAVPAGYLVVAGSQEARSTDKLTADLSQVVVVLGLFVGVFALAAAGCAWKLASGRGVRIATLVLEVLIAVICVPQSLATVEEPIPYAFPAMAVLATTVVVLVALNLNVSGRR
ncbi:hypothetical protein [Actinomadura oligospora]|uniref:hypothetical protein n=1 Tax=Actinomadura oligospora TaxID=111804 RepID=UPI00047E32DC|nr:hypothetical protein [Actinomadura oligospora]